MDVLGIEPARSCGALPHLARRSITFDSRHGVYPLALSASQMGTQTWFCDPQSPWQKGTIENTNRRARKWLSREVDPLSVTDADLIEICNRLNGTPRKCLGYRTPAEVFRKKLLTQMRHAGELDQTRKSRLSMNSHNYECTIMRRRQRSDGNDSNYCRDRSSNSTMYRAQLTSSKTSASVNATRADPKDSFAR